MDANSPDRPFPTVPLMPRRSAPDAMRPEVMKQAVLQQILGRTIVGFRLLDHLARMFLSLCFSPSASSLTSVSSSLPCRTNLIQFLASRSRKKTYGTSPIITLGNWSGIRSTTLLSWQSLEVTPSPAMPLVAELPHRSFYALTGPRKLVFDSTV